MTPSVWMQELKRRRVFRALAGYGMVSFALLQIIEPIMHGLSLPDWILKVTVLGLGVGLPVTLLLSWAYDLNPGGIERTPSVGPGSGWRTVALVSTGLLLASPMVGYYLFLRAPRAAPAPGVAAAASAGASAPPDAASPSVAVLPFVNMSDDPGNEYFSDGLSEEILNALAQVPGLRVPARTSSFAFKGKSQDVGKIAEALRVATVLEGSVRKAAGRVRITAQLVNAADGYHLWSQTFDRELKDVFAIQDEIATAIAGALRLRLSPGIAGGARKPGATANPEAYEAYLQGRHALNERTRPSIERAIAGFQKAVALDPGFAVAWADQAVAVALLSQGQYGEVPIFQALARARPLLEKAQSLAPDRPEVLAAAGLLEWFGAEPERALQLFDRALAQNPSSGELQSWRKGAFEALGRWDRVMPASEEAVRVDPLSKIALVNYIWDLQKFGRDGEIGPAVERLRGLDPSWALLTLGTLSMTRGDRAEAVRQLVPALQQGRDLATWELAAALADLGLRAEALRVQPRESSDLSLWLGDLPRAVELGQAALRAEPEDLKAELDLFLALSASGRLADAAPLTARVRKASRGKWADPGILLLQADAARSVGHAEEAAGYRQEAAQQLEAMQRGGVTASSLAIFQACLFAYDGRDPEAVAQLSKATGNLHLPHVALEMPLFSRLRSRPDFQAVRSTLLANLASQRARVVRMLCGPEPISATWQPAPETCAGLAPTR